MCMADVSFRGKAECVSLIKNLISSISLTLPRENLHILENRFNNNKWTRTSEY